MPIYVLPASGRGFAFAKQGNYCLPPAGVLHSQNKVIKCAAYGVTIMNGRVGGCLYMYCLPPSGVLLSQNKVINAP
jgi:hypothetical protein